ncbi:hypothetical protein Taro_034339 [Colocasia esculenta]|uniref:Uncharacterized protein n=1 Tax=Colocasia esculenta TaxID=4460 RepID=A0A843VXJ4_COLES|nr:hypothetical protein [Colocasia esculenta]
MSSVEKQSGPDLVAPSPPESIDSQGTLLVAVEEKSAGSQNLKEEISLSKDEEKASTSGPDNATTIDLPADKLDQIGFLDSGTHHSGVYHPNVYAPQVQTIYYGGYENPPIEWDDYPQFLNPEGVETGSHGSSLMFHTGYGYSPQMPYGPYSPVTTPLSSSSRDNHMYSTQHFTFAGPYFQQPSHVTVPYLNSPSPVSQVDLTLPMGTEQGFGGFGSGGPWSDWSKSPDGQRSLTPFSPAASPPPPSGSFGTFGRSLSPFSSGVNSDRLHQPI